MNSPTAASRPRPVLLLATLLAVGLGTSVCSSAPTDRPPVERSAKASATGPAAPARLVLISWDGAADWVVDRLLSEGKLPNLEKLAKGGVRAAHSQSSFPSKTAAGHAAVFTGTWPSVNGITANSVPALDPSRSTLLDRLSGFSSYALTAEPFYVTAARAGRKVVVLSATQSYPEDPHLETLRRTGVPADRFTSFSGFEHRLAERRWIDGRTGPGRLGAVESPWPDVSPAALRGAREAQVEIAGSRFYLLALDDPTDPTVGLDTLLIRQGSSDPTEAVAEDRLKPYAASRSHPVGWSRPFRLTAGGQHANTFFRLFDLAPDGSALALYQRQASALEGAASAAEREMYEGAYPGFHDIPFDLYSRGAFGDRIFEGGDGTAEARVLEMVALDTDFLIQGTEFALAQWNPDLLFHYSPAVDSAGHTWVGLLDPTKPSHDPVLADALWPFYEGVYAHMDRWLGAILDAVPGDTIVALFSDHGMEGVSRIVWPNRILEDAGLLHRTPGGAIDLTRTQALAPPFDSFHVWVNEDRWVGGIVPPSQVAEVRRLAEVALESALDPLTGRPLIADAIPSEVYRGVPLGGPRGPHLHLELAPHVYSRSGLADAVATDASPPHGEGHHGFWPGRRSMHAIFYAAGPGLAEGAELPGVRHIDIVPTLAEALGLPRPPDATGEILRDALIGAP